MLPSNIKHIDSDPCCSLLFFCHKHIHSVTELRCVAQEHHTTQIIVKPKGRCSPMPHDGPTGTKKAVDNGAGEMKQVTPITAARVTSRSALSRSNRHHKGAADFTTAP
jgi:hypothetical protein